MSVDDAHLVDHSRTRCLCDVGAPGYWAVTAVAADGTEHLVIAELDSLGDDDVRYDPACPAATHEKLGELPLEYVRRVTAVSRRTHLCGRPTKHGRPCRLEVAHPGAACTFHATRADA